MIQVDDEFAKSIGFTSDKFHPFSYLWKRENEVMISMIGSRQSGQGFFRDLLSNIETKGFKIAVPTPFARMRDILTKLGFKKGEDFSPDFGPVEVWRKDSP